MGANSKGDFKNLPCSGHISVEIFPLTNYFFDAAVTSNRISKVFCIAMITKTFLIVDYNIYDITVE